MANVKPIPDGYHAITPYLYIKGNAAAKAIDFYTKVFGAKEQVRMDGPGGTIGHAELQFGDSVVMLADGPERAPDARNGATSSLMLYVTDVDNVFKRALEAGASELQAVEDKFYGDRTGVLRDPFGQEWNIGTHIEDVSPEEMSRRMAAMPAMS